ncbi:response regulator transcription factor [Sphingomonas sp. ST-64]|uniref:Response regulator transcription factor n=1 Tax=Sphingomonas plantiphila TaxID=3163295 RepID=A0ABW8YMB3_9SPHN
MSKPIRVLIADDHMVVRHGVAQLLSAAPDVTVVGEAQSGEEAVARCTELVPDIVLMDIRMPGMGGLAAAEAIRRACPNVRVIGLSTFAETHTVTSMLATGARAHLAKSVTFDELIGAIRKVAAGETVEPAPPPRSSTANGSPSPAITGQQRRALALLAKGFTNAEIAGYLGVSISTANYHVGAILAKLGVSNRAEAAAIATREQLIDEGDL